jgi:hypothetical protein
MSPYDELRMLVAVAAWAFALGIVLALALYHRRRP